MAKVKMPFVWTGEMYVRPAGRGIDLEGLAPPESDCDRTDLGEVLPEGRRNVRIVVEQLEDSPPVATMDTVRRDRPVE